MKLRDIFSVAAAVPVFLAGISFVLAEEPIDEAMRRETIYPLFGVGTASGEKDTYAKYPDYEAGNNTLPAALFQYAGIAGAKSGWTYDAAGYENNVGALPFNGDLTRSDVPASQSEAGSKPVEDEQEISTAYRSSSEDSDEFRIYDFSIPFADSVTAEIGFTGRTNDDGQLASFAANPAESGDSQFSDKGVSTILFFEKNAFNKDSNMVRIISGNFRFGENKKGNDSGHSPFSIPFSLLCLALALGVILVIHTATGKQSSNQ